MLSQSLLSTANEPSLNILNDNLYDSNKKYNVIIFASGSRGDIQPYLGLGCHLQLRGHNITIATELRMHDLVKEFNLNYKLLKGDPTGVLFEPKAQYALKNGSLFSLIKLTEEWDKKFDKLDVLNSYIEAVEEDTDIIISSGLTMTASYCVAEKKKIAWIPMILGPTLSTSEFPIFLLKNFIICSCLNKWSYSLLFSMLWGSEKKFINPWRINELKLPALPEKGKGISDIINHVNPPILIACSSVILPRRVLPEDYPINARLEGFVFVPKSLSDIIDPNLIEFLGKDPMFDSQLTSALPSASNRPVIYLGFGSMPAPNPYELIKMTIDICQLCRVRAILVAGWSQLFNPEDRNEVMIELEAFIKNGTILALKAVPHDWLFPRVNVIVHHCGIGTSAAALRAGVPQVACPFMLDQPHNAQILVKLEVTPHIVPYNSSINAKKLAKVINIILNDTQGKKYRDAAKAVSEIIENESATSLDKYCDVIERYAHVFKSSVGS